MKTQLVAAKETLVRNRSALSIHKTANSPTENTSQWVSQCQCRFWNHNPNRSHWIPPLRVPPRHITLLKNLHQPVSSTFGNNYIGGFWQVSEWIWCWNTTESHLRTSKGGFILGKKRKSASLVIFCFVFYFEGWTCLVYQVGTTLSVFRHSWKEAQDYYLNVHLIIPVTFMSIHFSMYAYMQIHLI